ncbi:aminotransferase class I/II-fold pyridoxal phosphate-dependent enzyme [Defluviimonas sp. SAOS-178_SWC]|uniref:aminotransferase class I/II-fold pyridoxal phosphate-dependent enzyme n=1 Tax=Defluviimonas sp. SAOS-178_SWC TaxID=3121287 RepID=UPI003221B7A3
MIDTSDMLLDIRGLKIEGQSGGAWQPIVKGVDLTLRRLRGKRIAYVAQSAAAAFNPAFRTVLRPGDHVVTVCPSFGLHEFGAQACGAHVTKVPFSPDWSFPLDGLARAMSAEAPRVLIVSSPSNPAGPAISAAEFGALLAATPADTLVVFDEAYLEYLDPDMRFDAMARLAAGPHPWIVLRTFSTAYGLAGVRVGYGIASAADLVAPMVKARNPFGVNALAVAAARAALRDADYLARSVALYHMGARDGRHAGRDPHLPRRGGRSALPRLNRGAPWHMAARMPEPRQEGVCHAGHS